MAKLYIRPGGLSTEHILSSVPDMKFKEWQAMIFETLAVGPLSVNCFILGCEETREGVVVRVYRHCQHGGSQVADGAGAREPE